MSANKSTGRIFLKARHAKSMTQKEVAEKTGVHPNTIAKIEQGIQNPSFPTTKKLMKVLDLSLSDFPT